MNTISETALLLIDAQVDMFEPLPVANAALLLQTLQSVLARARAAGMFVIHVRNNGPAGDPEVPGTPGWQIHPLLAPLAGELVVDKYSPDAFAEPKLLSELELHGTHKIIMAGLQTEYCMDATCRSGLALGFDVTIIADGHSTFDDTLPAAEIIQQYNQIWAQIVRVLPAENIL